MRLKLAFLGLAAHLSLVAVSALHRTPWANRALLDPVLSRYANWSGADNAYTFFAPAVPDQVVADVVLRDGEGHAELLHLGRHGSELDHRIASLLFWFTRAAPVDFHSRTIAAFALNEHPRAITARVELLAYRVPALRAAADGARPALEEFHWAEYRRP